MQENVVYQASVTTETTTENYVGLASNFNFKFRFSWQLSPGPGRRPLWRGSFLPTGIALSSYSCMSFRLGLVSVVPSVV